MASWINDCPGLEGREIHLTPPGATVVILKDPPRFLVAGQDFAAYMVDWDGNVTPVPVHLPPLDTDHAQADDASPEA